MARARDILFVKPVLTCSPACAVIGGKKDATTIGPGKDIRAADSKSKNIGVRHTAIDAAVQLVPLLVERKTPPS